MKKTLSKVHFEALGAIVSAQFVSTARGDTPSGCVRLDWNNLEMTQSNV